MKCINRLMENYSTTFPEPVLDKELGHLRTSERVEDQESLQSTAVVRQSAHLVQHCVDDFLNEETYLFDSGPLNTRRRLFIARTLLQSRLIGVYV